jgi:Asp-tRNA(Asn)/Glu-tRNA(Gln) amidotransferase A subunit family amidase
MADIHRRRFLLGSAGVAAAVLGESSLTACRSVAPSSRSAPDLHYARASDFAAGIIDGSFDARQIAMQTLERLDSINPRLNAVVAAARDELITAADELDRNDTRPSLAGVPVTIKDAIDVSGMPTTWGNPDWKNNVAATDAEVVKRLRAEGAFIVGKTNVSLMLGDVEETTNPLFGPTRNPWNTGRVTGGSSGGSAAAVAAGLSCLDIGSDLGGSIRIPSAMCGVYGFKPTPGIVPLAGFMAPGESAAPMLDSVVALGPIARSASDIRLSLRAIAGPVGPAATTLEWACRSRAVRPHRRPGRQARRDHQGMAAAVRPARQPRDLQLHDRRLPGLQVRRSASRLEAEQPHRPRSEAHFIADSMADLLHR